MFRTAAGLFKYNIVPPRQSPEKYLETPNTFITRYTVPITTFWFVPTTMLRQLFHDVTIILAGTLALSTIQRLACSYDWTPLWVYQTANWAGACPARPVATIPSLLISPELKSVVAPVSRRMPDTTAMSNNRLELGKIVAALASVDTPQSQLAVEAVKRYDDQSGKTILGIGKLNAASELTADTAVYILEGLIGALNRASLKHKSSDAVKQIISLQQDQIDAWIQGLQDQLRRLHELSVSVQVDLAACENNLQQIYDTAGAAKGERERADDDLDLNARGLVARLFFRDDRPVLRAPVLQAIKDFEALILATKQAQGVVTQLSDQLHAIIGGIEAAYRYHDKMLVVEMTMEEKVDMTLESLRKLKKDIERAKMEH